ncbi:50S ribosomal protein L10e [Candidatus Bilamarchaeum dharawalense]|uniref:50S ribosomal protein L10e n=1 Tax=Candidatus Bilamarchaeum dharawalense TaxID=2885759 RepID=A0A5E4LS79_9ARCH|nr:50S ribosomal protein L10e [Candidatus Bilamarchaeum dharawalense]
MGIRPGRAIRDADKVAWTRYSKSKPRKSFIKAMPHADLHQYRMGAMKDDFDLEMSLVSEHAVIIRDNAIESARQSSNKALEKDAPGNYYFVVRVYPHHVVRENKMIAGAGADRLQKGMRQAFGRPTDRAARLKAGSALFTVYSYKANEAHLKKALIRAKMKLSGKYRIRVK